MAARRMPGASANVASHNWSHPDKHTKSFAGKLATNATLKLLESRAIERDIQPGQASRTSERKPTFLLVQCLRGVAALMVVAHHATIIAFIGLGDRAGIWANGTAGVDIFFVISGFVMGISTSRISLGTHSAFQFMTRRVERIAPIYWIFTSVRVFSVLAFPSHATHSLGTPWHVIASYLFLPSRSYKGEVFPVLELGWSLIFEMAFYLVLSTATALRVRKRIAFMTAALCVVAAISFVIPQNNLPFVNLIDPIILEFLYGLLLSAAYLNRSKAIAWSMWLAPVGLWMILAFEPGRLLRPFIWGIPALMLVAAAVALEPVIKNRVPRWALEVGNSSYSTYLTHGFVLPVLGFVFARSMLLRTHVHVLIVPTALIVSAIVGYLVYRYLELPIMRFFIKRKNASALLVMAEK